MDGLARQPPGGVMSGGQSPRGAHGGRQRGEQSLRGAGGREPPCGRLRGGQSPRAVAGSAAAGPHAGRTDGSLSAALTGAAALDGTTPHLARGWEAAAAAARDRGAAPLASRWPAASTAVPRQYRMRRRLAAPVVAAPSQPQHYKRHCFKGAKTTKSTQSSIVPFEDEAPATSISYPPRCKSRSGSNQPEAVSTEGTVATKQRPKVKKQVATKKKKEPLKKIPMLPFDSPAMGTRSKRVDPCSPAMSTRSKRRLSL
ncbi:hypothetical protein U9M48_032016 [Paspalum notatum var. saurae]|uniref:Uncharacterized protein n=1 Tax=Paspalum notatum var. saurae TaxID=547442 RepID=A0AAQ3U544_PASNO